MLDTEPTNETTGSAVPRSTDAAATDAPATDTAATATAATDTAVTRPRRRRAASRPAGPPQPAATDTPEAADQAAGPPDAADQAAGPPAADDEAAEPPAAPPTKKAARARRTTKKAAAAPEAPIEPPAGEADADTVPAATGQPAPAPAPGDVDDTAAAPARARRTRKRADAPAATTAPDAAFAPAGAGPRGAAATVAAATEAVRGDEAAAAGPDVPDSEATAAAAALTAAPAVAFAAPTVLFVPPTQAEQEPAPRARRTRRSEAATQPFALPDEAAATSPAVAEDVTDSAAAAAVEITAGVADVQAETASPGSDVGTATVGDTTVDDATGEAATDDDGDTDDEAGGSRRRRRRGGRGRRGRSRTSDEDLSDLADTSAAASPADTSAAAGPADTSAAVDTGTSAAAVTGAEGDDDDAAERGDRDADESEDDSSPASRRRRRRRRRGANGGADDAEQPVDDPEHTVVHVREPRRRERADRGDRSDRSDRSDEVTSIKGSTRLEAKKQRRREGREQGRRRTPVLSESEFLARRESVERVMVVREAGERTQIAVLEDGVLVEHFVTRETSTTFAGNVYLGRVQNVLPSMEAAFVDIGKSRNAVLYAGEVNWDAAGLEGQPRRIESALKSGDAVLAQVTKDPIGHKGARLTSQISLPGRYLVYVPDGSMTGISRKLPDTERSRLKAILKRIVPDDAGVIVRTAAEGASEQELERDVTRLASQWADIQAKQRSASAPALLHGEPDLMVRVVRDIFNEDFTRLVIAGAEAWDTITSYVGSVAPDLVARVERWVQPQDVFAAHRVDEQLTKALDRKVWLPSGGYLVIDDTEAMTVVDVNTGKFTGKGGGNLEETVTRNNIEAAEEIVRQLRLRDIGGIIVMDFIDMVLESNRDLVLRRLLECLGRDRTKHQVAEVTSLGLVQMTRKRVGQGLLEAFSETCEHCHGRGHTLRLDAVEAAAGSNGRGRGHSPEKAAAAAAAVAGIAAATRAHLQRDSHDLVPDDAGDELAGGLTQPDEPAATAREPFEPAVSDPEVAGTADVRAAPEPGTSALEPVIAEPVIAEPVIGEQGPVAPLPDEPVAAPARRGRGRRAATRPAGPAGPRPEPTSTAAPTSADDQSRMIVAGEGAAAPTSADDQSRMIVAGEGAAVAGEGAAEPGEGSVVAVQGPWSAAQDPVALEDPVEPPAPVRPRRVRKAAAKRTSAPVDPV